MFSVRVVNDNQDGAPGLRVMLEFTGLLRGVSSDANTDSDGYAEFDGYDDGDAIVYVDGDNVGTYRYEDGGSITITQ